ncbi:MAG: alpha/beta fold hydrolase [Promethearchaeota archaeon]
MPKAKVNNIEIEYETFGDPSSKPLLLIMGLGSQMIRWDVEICELLVNCGFYVIRFDNRDVGLSTKLEEAGEPDVMKLFMAAQKGEPISAPYTLDDMADDAIGVLDALNIQKAHICGASMGGMITQIIGYRHPLRVLSLCSIMSSTGNPDLPPPKPEAMKILLAPAPTEREANIEGSIKRMRVLYGSGFPFNEKKARKIVTESYDRCFYPPGYIRQIAAIMATGNRREKVATIKAPTLVIHGGDDPLVSIEGGKDTAKAINGSKLLIIDGMGHSMPPETWPRILEAITSNAAKGNK